jgi:tape measure domain-containing protein
VSKYSADIEIAVRGGQQLDRTIKTLNRLNNSINVVTRNAKLLEGKGFNVASIENYSRAVSKAERAVRKAAEGTNQERQAITALVSAMELENKARERKNILIAREIANQRRVIATANAGVGMQGPAIPAFMRTGPSSPLRGSRAIPGSPAALAAAGRGGGGGGGGRLGGAISGAIIGGSFPLLFGQSGGAAAGGAIGGLAGGLLGPGGSFAGSLLGTLLGEVASKGQQVKELAADIGFTADQTKRLQEAFALAGRDSDKFIEAVQNIRGLSLSLDDQADAVQLVSNLTETYGGKIEKVTNAFTSALESGRVTQATLNQLTSQGIPIQETLAKKYEVSRDKLLEMAKDGQIPVQDLIDLLVSLGNTSEASATKTATGWGKAWEDFKSAASLALQGAVAVFNGITGAGVQSSGNIAAVFAAMYVELVKGAISMGVRVSSIFANLARGGANLAATFQLGGLNVVAGANVAAFKNVEKTLQAINTNLQNIDVSAPQAGRVGAITAPGQLPPSGGGGGGAKPKTDRAAEEKQRLDALLKQLREEIKIRTESIGLEKSLLDARADQNDELEAQLQSSVRLLDIGSKQAVVQKNFDAGRIGRAEYTLRLQLLELDRTEDQIKYEEDLNRIFKERYGITEALARLARETRTAAFGGTGATGTFRTDMNLMPGLTGGVLGEEYSEVKTQLEELLTVENQVASAADTIGQAFGNSFKGIIDGTLSAQEALANFFSSVADAFADMAAQMIAQWIRMQIIGLAQSLLPGGSTVFPQGVGNFSSAFGSGSSVAFNPAVSFGGFRAAGGSVTSGSSYVVGEKGPELFVPGRSGTIVPNGSMGGNTSNIVVNVDASGSRVEGDEQEGKQLGRVIAAAIQQELVKQKRPGGLLA